jgi:hypothetical protein
MGRRGFAVLAAVVAFVGAAPWCFAENGFKAEVGGDIVLIYMGTLPGGTSAEDEDDYDS